MPVVTRYRDHRRILNTDYCLLNASPETGLADFARVAREEHCSDGYIQRANREAGLVDYEVRNGAGRQHLSAQN